MSQSLRESLFQWMTQYVYRYAETPFQLASGLESHHYFNCKEITLHPKRLAVLAEFIVSELVRKIPESFEAVGGLTLGADPMAYAIALEFQKQGKLVYPLVVRKEPKGHGTGQQIEGYWKEVKQCLVLDDVITTGGSTLKAVKALREAGIQVTSGVCILDREEGGFENLQKEAVQMYPIFKKAEFLK
ncbi:MAG: orotate phosphoribosyltransferase [Leptospira sp.]|nr:orotate phosphoribosyltransferase [Leptospira sp.]